MEIKTLDLKIVMKNLNMLYRVFSIGLLSMLFFACGGDNDSVPVDKCRVTSASTSTLVFDDITINGYNEHFPEKLYFEYDASNRIIKTRGGLRATYGLGSLAPMWTLFGDVNDTIMYDNGTIRVKYSNGSETRPYDKEFVLSGNELLSRKVTLFDSTTHSITSTYTYEYTGSGVVEKKDNFVYRTFTIENGNLIKVELFDYDPANGSGYKEEYFFDDYDTSDNLLKGKFYINGAFFKAFSNNNYRSYRYNNYIIENGVYRLRQSFEQGINFTNGPENFPNLFTRTCD